MSLRLDSRAIVAAGFALVLAACVIGPKPDDPLNGADGTAVSDAGADVREIADVGVVPNADTGLALDAPGSGLGDAAPDTADTADAPDADARGDAADAGADGGADDAPSHGGDAAALDGADDAATDGGPE